MGPLRNPRHEKFVQALFEGKPANKAYEEAGYCYHEGNAIRLRSNEKVQARLAELQAKFASEKEITIGSLLAELEECRAKATDLKQLSAAIKAIELKAKLAGVMVEKVEVGGPGSFDECHTTAAIVDQMLAELILRFHPVDERDRQALIELMERHYREVQEYIDAINARPIVAERVDPHHLETPWQQLRPYSAPARLPARGNGSRRY